MVLSSLFRYSQFQTREIMIQMVVVIIFRWLLNLCWKKNEDLQIWSRFSLFKNTGCRLPALSSAALKLVWVFYWTPKLGGVFPWCRHQMETFSALLAICAGNSPVTGEFPAQRPLTRSFDVFFGLRLNKRLSKQSLAWGWLFETPSR